MTPNESFIKEHCVVRTSRCVNCLTSAAWRHEQGRKHGLVGWTCPFGVPDLLGIQEPPLPVQEESQATPSAAATPEIVAAPPPPPATKGGWYILANPIKGDAKSRVLVAPRQPAQLVRVSGCIYVPVTVDHVPSGAVVLLPQEVQYITTALPLEDIVNLHEEY